MSLTPRIIPNNWTSVQQAVAKLASLRLGVDSTPTFAGLSSGDLTLSKICTVAAGLNVLRVTGLQVDGTAMTGTLRGAYIDVSNGSTAATGTIRALELKARTEAPGDSGSNVAVLEGLSISADSKDHSVTTMRAAEFILDGKTGGTITEAVGLRIANNLQANKATTSYALQIYRDSFDYTADIQLSSGGTIGGSSGDMKIDSNGDLTLNGDLILNGNLILSGDLLPGTNDLHNLGSSSYRWRDLYCLDISASRDIVLQGGQDSDLLFKDTQGNVWFRIEPKNSDGDIQFMTPLGTEICFSIAGDEVMKLDSSGNLFLDGLVFSSSPVRILEAVQIQDDLVATNYIQINHNSIISNTGAISFGDENLATTGNIRIDSDSSVLDLGDTTGDYTIGWDGSDAVHTITAGDFVFTGGNFGIGTVGPSEALEIAGSIRGDQSGALRISTGSGYVDIGPQNASYCHYNTDRAANVFDKSTIILETATAVSTSSSSGRGLASTQVSANINGALCNFKKGRGTSWWAPQTINGGDYIATFTAQAREGGNWRTLGNFGYKSNAAVGSNDIPGEWFWATSASTDSDPYTNGTVRMVINSDGNIGIRTVTPTVALDVVGDIKATGFLELTQKAGTTIDGDLWNDSTQEALQTFVSGIEQTLVGVIFTQTADQTIANTTTETTFFGTGVGTLTLPANFWVIGKTIRVKIHGDMADTGNPTAEVQAYYGATSLIDSGAITLSGLAGTEEWECEVIITCRSIGATGTVQTVINWEYETTTGSSAIERLDVAGVLQTIDTTAPGVLDVTFQWGTAAVANTIHSHVAFVEVLN